VDVVEIYRKFFGGKGSLQKGHIEDHIAVLEENSHVLLPKIGSRQVKTYV